jgi:membrane-associated PAP2 superfamily phosphatase
MVLSARGYIPVVYILGQYNPVRTFGAGNCFCAGVASSGCYAELLYAAFETLGVARASVGWFEGFAVLC